MYECHEEQATVSDTAGVSQGRRALAAEPLVCLRASCSISPLERLNPLY